MTIYQMLINSAMIFGAFVVPVVIVGIIFEALAKGDR